MLPEPIVETGRLAPVFQVLRRQPDRGVREDLGAVADRGVPVDHRGRADRAVAADADVRTDDRKRADDRARADHRGRRYARQRIDVRDRLNRKQQLRFDDGLSVDFGDRRGLHERATRRAERHHELQLIAGNDLLAELRAINAAQVHPRALTAADFIEQQQRRRLRQRLDHEDRRHQRLVRKVSLEEVFVDGDVLERDQPLPRLVLGDRVDEERGKAVREAFEDARGRPGVH